MGQFGSPADSALLASHGRDFDLWHPASVDAGAAIELAEDLADYLGSGFGQTNYVADTQFAVSTLGDTIVFTTWSQRRSDDPERAEAAFDAVAEAIIPNWSA